MQKCGAHDLFRYRQLSSPKGVAGGGWLVFGCRQANEDDDKDDHSIWGLKPGTSADPVQLTTDASSASSPMPHPRLARIAFLSNRDDSGKQVYVLDLDGGEARQLTQSKSAKLMSIEQWAGDGKHLLALASVEWDSEKGGTREQGDAPDKEEKGGHASRPTVIRHLPYKQDGSGITAGTRTHLFSIDAEDGRMVPLTQGDFDVSMGAWSPDGETLAIVRHRGGRERHRTDLWLAGPRGEDARILVDSLASISSMEWSPDGKALVLAAGQEVGDSSVGLWLTDLSGNVRQLGGADFELSSSAKPFWHPDGKRIGAVAESRSLHRAAVIDVPSGDIRLLDAGLLSVETMTACADRLYCVTTGHDELDEIRSFDWGGGDHRVHTQLNSWFAGRSRPDVSLRRFSVPDGEGGHEDIEAWVLLPKEDRTDGAGPWPLLVDMHGGPHSIALVDFGAHLYWHLLLARGWAIVAPNAVGSTSYGRDFERRLRGRWGELDLPQYEAVIRKLQEEGIADDRVACAGKSYGGFLSAWAIGNSEVFRAAAVAAPVANIGSHMGTSDSGYYVTPFAMESTPGEAPERYRQLSPVTHCRRARAATLILQGEEDGRCPIGQSEELFSHLVRCTDAPVEMVLYPGSSHAVAESGRPSNRVDYHSRIADWLEDHAGGGDGERL